MVGDFCLSVRWRGLEPPRLTTHAPQACLSANSSTSANSQAGRIIIVFIVVSSKVFLGIMRQAIRMGFNG